jgi:hypothetical protein
MVEPLCPLVSWLPRGAPDNLPTTVLPAGSAWVGALRCPTTSATPVVRGSSLGRTRSGRSILQHDVYEGDPPIIPEMIPPRAPAPGETWVSTIHLFRRVECGWDLLLWDAN